MASLDIFFLPAWLGLEAGNNLKTYRRPSWEAEIQLTNIFIFTKHLDVCMASCYPSTKGMKMRKDSAFEKVQYGILMHIYGILKDDNDNPICKTEKET